MSVSSWKAEFYPIKAAGAIDTPLIATQHCIRKWEGLHRRNREAHALVPIETLDVGQYRTLQDRHHNDEAIDVIDETCALCAWTQVETADDSWDKHPCDTCPLSIVRGGHACTHNIPGEETDSPYTTYIMDGDVEPMLLWLHRTEAYLMGQETPLKKEAAERVLSEDFSCPHCSGSLRLTVDVGEERTEVIVSAPVAPVVPVEEPRFALHTDAGKLRLAAWRAGVNLPESTAIRNDKLPTGHRRLTMLVWSLRGDPLRNTLVMDNLKEHVADIFGERFMSMDDVDVDVVYPIQLAIRVYLNS